MCLIWLLVQRVRLVLPSQTLSNTSQTQVRLSRGAREPFDVYPMLVLQKWLVGSLMSFSCIPLICHPLELFFIPLRLRLQNFQFFAQLLLFGIQILQLFVKILNLLLHGFWLSIQPLYFRYLLLQQNLLDLDHLLFGCQLLPEALCLNFIRFKVFYLRFIFLFLSL